MLIQLFAALKLYRGVSGAQDWALWAGAVGALQVLQFLGENVAFVFSR